MPNTSTPNEPPIDVLNDPCPTARVSTELPLALIEEIDQARGNVSRSDCLRTVISAAMTHSSPQPLTANPGPAAMRSDAFRASTEQSMVHACTMLC